MTRSTTLLAILAVVTLALTGCSETGNQGETTGSPVPTPPVSAGSAPMDSSPVNVDLPHSGAPAVRNPLPAETLAGNPCQALTPQQVSTILGFEEQGKPNVLPTGPQCSWANNIRNSQVIVSFISKTGQGLSGVYENTKPISGIWNELPEIQGFPAVAHVNKNIMRTPGDYCQVSVGLADNLSIDIGGYMAHDKVGVIDPCEATAGAADMVVTTLRQQVGK